MKHVCDQGGNTDEQVPITIKSDNAAVAAWEHCQRCKQLWEQASINTSLIVYKPPPSMVSKGISPEEEVNMQTACHQ